MEDIADLQTELICRYDPNLRLTYANNAYSLWLGKPKDQLIGTRFMVRNTPEERPYPLSHLQSLTAEHPVTVSTHTTRLPGGTPGIIEWTDRALFDSGDRLTGYLCVGRDVTERERQAGQILELKDQLTAVLDTMQDAIISATLPDRRLIYASASVEKVFGYPLVEIMGSPDFYQKVLHPDDLEPVTRAMENGLREGFAELDHRVVWPDGQVHWLHRRIWVRFDGTGQPESLIDTARDITDRKQTELALQQTSRTLELFVENAPAAIAMFDREMRYLAASRRWYADFHLPDQNVIGRSHYEIFPEIPDRWRQIHQRCLGGAIETSEADLFPRADGTLDWVRWEVRPWRDSQDQIGGLIFFSEVITAQKEAEDALRRSEARYRQMFEVHGLPKLILDPVDGQIVDANPAAADYYGYDLATLKTLKIFAINQSPPELIKAKLADAAAHRLTAFHFKHRLANGTIRDVEVFSGPIEYDGKQRLFSTITDVTEREKAKTALEEANHLLEKRVAGRTAELQTTKNRLEAIFNHSGDAILLLAIEQGIQQANQTFEQLTSSQPAGFIGQPLQAFLQPESTAEITAAIQKVTTTQQKQQIEARTLTGFEVEISLAPVNRSDGAITSLVCIIRDITGRKKTQAELQRYAAEIEDLYNLAPTGYHSLDSEGIFVRINDTELNWLGYNREEVVGKLRFPDILTPASRETFRQNFPRFLQQGWIKDLEFEIVRKDGSTFPVLLSATAICDAAGHYLHSRSTLFENTILKKAQQAVAEERNLLRTIIDTIPDYIYVKDLSHRHLLINLPYARSLGINNLAEGAGQSDQVFFPSEIVASSQANEDIIFQTGQPVINSEERSLNRDGSEILALTTRVPLRNLEGEITGLVGITRDITERKQAEQALRESEERYRQTISAMSEGIVVQNTAGAIELCNAAAEQILGLTAGQMMGRMSVDPRWQAIHEDGTPFPGETHPAMYTLRTGLPQQNVVMGVHKPDGTLTWILISSQPLLSSEGQVYAAISTFADITERQQAEERIREAEELFRILFETLPDAVFVTNTRGSFLNINPAASRLLGYSREELLQLAASDFMELSPAEITQRRQQFLTTGFWQDEIRLKTKEGKQVLADARSTLVEMPGNRERLSVLLLRDITTRKQAEENLKLALEKEKELGELKTRFVSMASHEFRTPLASILATAETLTNYRDRMDSAQIDARLDKIRQQVLRLKDIMDDVLQQARIQAGRVEFKPVPGDLEALCRDIIEEYENQPGNQGRLIYKGPVTAVTVNYDQHLMRQIISNLISNALKYSPTEQPVQITLTQDKTHLRFQVSDRGIGIPSEDLKHLFEPFHRASNVGTISGTGLGLNITRMAVEMHGGTITAENRPERGTTFTVILPFIPPAAIAPETR